MGRKKKPFIDKKKAQTFSLVPRSQKDPLAGDSQEPQYVLKPSEETGDLEEEHLQEQHKYGIYFEDDYDYLQHLKEPGTAVMEPMMESRRQLTSADKSEKVLLPKALFGSEVAVEGDLEKVLPVTGPQPDWDPDIVAALEAAEDTSDICEDLEDDFVLLANGGQPGIPVYVTREPGKEDTGETPWWMGRGDFDSAMFEGREREENGDEGSDVAVDADSGDEKVVKFKEKKMPQFTEFSMSSSVVPRSETLTLLDDRFDGFMAGYDNAQLGAPEEDETLQKQESGGTLGHDTYNQLLLQSAAEDFEKNFQDQLYQLEEEDEDSEEMEEDQDDCENDEESRGQVSGPQVDSTAAERTESKSESSDTASEKCSSDDEHERFVSVEVDSSKRQWDCESILSTYSNLYNHPTKIPIPKEAKKQPIKLSAKTGMPIGAIPGPPPKVEINKQVPITRPRNENKEEKRTRKQAMKDERRQRRADKKATKLAFKSEELKQARARVTHTHTAVVA